MTKIGQPHISVCMITYGHEKFIKEAINGVLSQKTSFTFELLIFDDASPDKTETIVTSLITQHDKGDLIRYHRHEHNLGMMSNFSYALQQCHGKYIALCEGDDYWSDTDKLQKQVTFLESHTDYILVGHNAKFIRNNEKTDEVVRKIKELYVDFSTADLIKRNPFVSSMVTFKNNAMKNISEILSHFIVGDKAVFTHVSFFGKTRFYSEPVGYYRKHDQSVTSKNRLHYNPYREELINRIKHAEYWNDVSQNKFQKEMQSVREYRSRVLMLTALHEHDLKTAICYSKFVDLSNINKLTSKMVVLLLKSLSIFTKPPHRTS